MQRCGSFRATRPTQWGEAVTGIAAPSGMVSRGIGGDSLSHGVRREKASREVGHNGARAHAAVSWRGDPSGSGRV
jgi:hypothetical protein